LSKLDHVNTTDIGDAIRLGCRTMSSVFNADDHDIPFFESQVWPEARLAFNHAFSEAHVPGRHLNALLNAEAAIGMILDEDAVGKHERAAFFSYSGSAALPLNRTAVDGPLVNFLPHNVREGFHALYALTKYRDSLPARQLAEASIAAILNYWTPEHEWDRQRLESEHGIHVLEIGPLSTFITGLARAIGPLVKYYRAAAYGPALELALMLKEKAISEYFTADGSYDSARFGPHTHSTTCTLSSLAQLAELTHDAHLMQRVKTFYDNGLWAIRDALGWVIEMSSLEANPDLGEVNNTGDLVETALILGRWGYPEYYEDTERMVRSHLLPSQLRDVSFIQEPENPSGDDGLRHVADRHLGAFGFPAPYGHAPIGAPRLRFNMDIVGGAIGSLCEVYRSLSHHDSAGHWVHLLFDHETPTIQVESPYTHRALRIRVKRPDPLFVRIPSWVDGHAITVPESDETPRVSNGYLFLARPPVNRPLTISFPLPMREITLNHRTRAIRARLRGDEVIAMENFGAELTYFDPI
jgi:hypothetical protein